MAGQLESAIVEIRLMYNSFLSLMAINPDLPPDCIIECLEKYFGTRNGSMFTSASSRAQRKIMKNLESAYEAYKHLSRTSPKSAPSALIKTLGAIFTNCNQVKVETNEDESDSSVEIVDVESLQNGNNGNKTDDNNAEQCQDIDCSSDSDCVLVPNEQEVREVVPSTSFSSLPKQRQQWVKSWINGEPIPRPVPTSTCSSEQDENNVEEVAPQNPAGAENVERNADETGSNGDSSSSSTNASSSHSNQNKQQNDAVVEKLTPCVYRRTRGKQYSAAPGKDAIYECSHGCGKTFSTGWSRWYHEKNHCGKIKCDFCDSEFTARSGFLSHQRARHNPNQSPTVKIQRPKRAKSYKRIRCDFCYKKFANPEDLERHRAIRTQERLKRCRFPSCARGFCYEYIRVSHEESHRHGKL